MSKFSRRSLIVGGLSTVAGASGLAVAGRFAARYGLIPPDHGGIYGIGETLTYAAHRVLMSRGSAAREFKRSQISRTPHPNYPTRNLPNDEVFERHRAQKFANWGVTVEGSVARPTAFSLAQLKDFPPTTQITQLACEEGWSYIAEWTGVALSHVLNVAGVKPQARYVVFFTYQGGWETVDMPEALHPQTLVAYGMNGGDLPVLHGAPVRLRVPRQLGYKNLKHISRIVVADSLKDIGNGLGSPAVDVGFSWYAGI